jgi:hypothetical protein
VAMATTNFLHTLRCEQPSCPKPQPEQKKN